ncbi:MULTISPECIES: GNAT family N-acetyltransferase [unclassified Actinoplanes]|uniref:GNAT family N-acetyltransferase n=1 Tax=unclassified Actinoplanes TaxID=2626549 RepID=UPI0012F9CC66|nr:MULTISPECIES: GNAT family N-acetyltransferase [unclassified Actinoplanes]
MTVALAGPGDLVEAEAMMREVLEADLGGYRPQWHRDLDDLEAAYLRSAGCALIVARDPDGIVGTAGVKPCALASPPNPQWLAHRYSQPDVCQLVRVWVAAGGRRRGVGRAVAERAVAWSVGPGGYRRVYLHTDASVPGAEAFWRSLPTREVCDTRPDPFNTVHFEIDVAAMLRTSEC